MNAKAWRLRTACALAAGWHRNILSTFRVAPGLRLGQLAQLLVLIHLGCADTQPPTEEAASDLRLVPETSAVGEPGGPVFLQVEVSPLTESYAVFLEAHGATLAALPGVPTCSSGTGVGGAAGNGNTNPTKQVVPESAFDDQRCANEKQRCRSGVVVEIPAGNTDVLVVGTLAEVDSNCEPTSGLAISSARIGRSASDSAGDAGGAGNEEGETTGGGASD